MNPFAEPLERAVTKASRSTALSALQQADATTFDTLAAKVLVQLLKTQPGYSNRDRPMIDGAAILFRVHRHHGPLSASWVSASWAGHAVRITPMGIQIDHKKIKLSDARISELNVT